MVSGGREEAEMMPRATSFKDALAGRFWPVLGHCEGSKSAKLMLLVYYFFLFVLYRVLENLAPRAGGTQQTYKLYKLKSAKY